MDLAIPNLHPAVVHFPLVLAPLAVLVDLGSWRRRTPHWDRAATLAWVLAAVATTFAFIAGRFAADGLLHLPPRTQPVLSDHADWASWALTSVWIVALIRSVTLLTKARGPLSTALRTLCSLGAWGVKVMVDGQVSVHGHAKARPPGRVGLRFGGSGVVAVERVELVRIGDTP